MRVLNRKFCCVVPEPAPSLQDACVGGGGRREPRAPPETSLMILEAGRGRGWARVGG